MSISKEQVEHIAHLARIKLGEGEVKEFQEDLGGILEFIDQLQSVDVDNVEPLRTISGARDVLRADVHVEEIDRRPEGQALIGQASETKDGYVKTKGVFGEESSA